MKKVLLFFVLLLSFTLTVNSQTASLVDQVVSMLNSECPMDMGDGLTLTGASKTTDNMVMNFTLDAQSWKDANANQDLFKQTMLSMAASEEGIATIFSILIMDGKGLKMTMTNKATKQSFSVLFSKNELSSAIQ